MRVKTSITLSEETLAALDRVGGRNANRSQLIESAVVQWLAVRQRAAREARDFEIMNHVADKLNAEVEDALEFQAKR